MLRIIVSCVALAMMSLTLLLAPSPAHSSETYPIHAVLRDSSGNITGHSTFHVNKRRSSSRHLNASWYEQEVSEIPEAVWDNGSWLRTTYGGLTILQIELWPPEYNSPFGDTGEYQAVMIECESQRFLVGVYMRDSREENFRFDWATSGNTPRENWITFNNQNLEPWEKLLQSMNQRRPDYPIKTCSGPNSGFVALSTIVENDETTRLAGEEVEIQ